MFSLIIFILVSAIGFMMGVLYKRTQSTASFFNPDPIRASKRFYVFLFAALMVTTALTWWAVHSLRTTHLPEESSIRYLNTKSIVIFVVNLSFLLLMVLANMTSQSFKKIVVLPYLATLGFYILYVLIDGYIIAEHYSLWMQLNKLLKGELPDFHRNSHLKSGIALLVTCFNAIMIWWGLRK